MAKKRVNTPVETAVETAEETFAPREVLQLFVGVNFTAQGDTEETRIEAGLIDLGVLPPRFENELIERKLAVIRLN